MFRRWHSRLLRCSTASSPIIGIDLGTTHSSIAVMPDDGVLPLVLETFKRSSLQSPKNSSIHHFPETTEEADHFAIFERMNKIASSYFPHDTWKNIENKNAVVTVPVNFTDAQRLSTKKVAKLAGLNVVRMIQDPIAAALAFYHHHKRQEHQQPSLKDGDFIAVCDFGGKAFTFTILNFDCGIFEIASTSSSDSSLGGEKFDEIISNHYIEKALQFKTKNVEIDQELRQTISEAAEKAKIELSSSSCEESQISIPNHGSVILTRTIFDRLVSNLIERSLETCAKVLTSDGEDKSIDHVFMIGGMANVPKIAEAFSTSEIFGHHRETLFRSLRVL